MNWRFIFNKNSFKNKSLKLVIVDPETCAADLVVSKTNVSEVASAVYEVTPLKPLTHPVKDESVFPVYVIISSSIFNKP